MKNILITKLHAINLIIETIEENLRLLKQKISSRDLFISNGHANYYIKYEYYLQALEKNMSKFESLEKTLLKFN